MPARWLDRGDAFSPMRPAFLVSTSHRYLIFRFGREQHLTFSERYQGTRGIPEEWRYFFGKRLSIKYKRTKGQTNE